MGSGSLGSLGPGALGSRGPEPWDPGAREPWDPGARSPGIPGPRALGSRGPEPWDPGALGSLLEVLSRNRSGIGFLSSRIAGNDRLGFGSSKIEVLAKNSKKNQGKSMIFLVFPVWGPALESFNMYESPYIIYQQRYKEPLLEPWDHSRMKDL